SRFFLRAIRPMNTRRGLPLCDVVGESGSYGSDTLSKLTSTRAQGITSRMCDASVLEDACHTTSMPFRNGSHHIRNSRFFVAFNDSAPGSSSPLGPMRTLLA